MIMRNGDNEMLKLKEAAQEFFLMGTSGRSRQMVKNYILVLS